MTVGRYFRERLPSASGRCRAELRGCCQPWPSLYAGYENGGSVKSARGAGDGGWDGYGLHYLGSGCTVRMGILFGSGGDLLSIPGNRWRTLSVLYRVVNLAKCPEAIAGI